jgi:hypothetical protein
MDSLLTTAAVDVQDRGEMICYTGQHATSNSSIARGAHR